MQGWYVSRYYWHLHKDVFPEYEYFFLSRDPGRRIPVHFYLGEENRLSFIFLLLQRFLIKMVVIFYQ